VSRARGAARQTYKVTMTAATKYYKLEAFTLAFRTTVRAAAARAAEVILRNVALTVSRVSAGELGSRRAVGLRPRPRPHPHPRRRTVA
jgi:hypothetical protein